MLDRRTFMLSSSMLLIGGCLTKADINDEDRTDRTTLAATEIGKLERRIGGRLGVALVDSDGTLIMSHRGSERFAMCSTFKAPLASALFAAHEAGKVDIDTKFGLKATDSVPYMPFFEQKLAAGEPVSLFELAEAAVTTSDNAAANLVLKAIGGPQAFTRFVREHGDIVTRLDRIEPELNENVPGDPRDTTSPKAMAGLMQQLAIADAALDIDKLTLQEWLKNSKTGASRIRAGLPNDWLVGNKTGTASGGIARNDIAIIWPSTPEKAASPVILAIFVDRPTAPAETVDAAMADVARISARLLGASA